MFKSLAMTVSAVALVMLAIALGPNVPAAVATARAIITKDDIKLNEPSLQQSCAAFEVWFIDPTCRHRRIKKSARTTHPARG
jgi:hypothetical protein